MVFCTGQYWLRAVPRASIRIQLGALRAAADTERSVDTRRQASACCVRFVASLSLRARALSTVLAERQGSHPLWRKRSSQKSNGPEHPTPTFTTCRSTGSARGAGADSGPLRSERSAVVVARVALS